MILQPCLITMDTMRVIWIGLILALALSSDAAERDYGFDGKMSRQVLDNYLSRAVTLNDLLHGKGSVTNNLRFLTNTGPAAGTSRLPGPGVRTAEQSEKCC